SPIEPAACKQLDFISPFPYLYAIAVELYFVHPTLAFRRLFGEPRQARFEKRGHLRSQAGNLLNSSTAQDRSRLLVENIGIIRAPRSFIRGFDQQPGFLFFARPTAHPDEVPPAFELGAF